MRKHTRITLGSALRVTGAALIALAALFGADHSGAAPQTKLTCMRPATGEAPSRKCVALVIGNTEYSRAGRLPNATADARAVGVALGRLGFDVTVAENLDVKTFDRIVEGFAAKARGADVALFFYAGHALQLNEVNYLLPVDAELATELAVNREAISAQHIVGVMERAARINLVFLDACRNNPLAERLKASLDQQGRAASVGRGLSRMTVSGRDTLIVFSTEPGREALDGTGGAINSPFTTGFLAHIDTPDLEIETMLKRVTGSVSEVTEAKQQPERLSKLQSEFYFRLGEASVPPPTPPPVSVVTAPPVVAPTPTPAPVLATPATPPAPLPKSEVERAWSFIEDTEDATMVAAFRRQYGRDNPFHDRLAADLEAKLARKAGEVAEQKRMALLQAEDAQRRAEATRAGRVFQDCWEETDLAVIAAMKAQQGQESTSAQTPPPNQGRKSKAQAQPPAATTLKVCGPEMVVVPTGRFTMGSPPEEEGRGRDEGPQRAVEINQPFAVGKFEVTEGEWGACIAAGSCKPLPNFSQPDPKVPMRGVSWIAIQEDYIPWLNKKTGKTYRLLSEAEWEYAARGGTTTAYMTGKTITSDQVGFLGLVKNNVGLFPPNAFGLKDMHGNVWEWVADCYRDTYNGAPADGAPLIFSDCGLRAMRGGSMIEESRVRSLRSANREGFGADYQHRSVGFRVGLTL